MMETPRSDGEMRFSSFDRAYENYKRVQFWGHNSSIWLHTSEKDAIFSHFSHRLCMHAPNRTEPWIEVTRRNEVMLLSPFDRAYETRNEFNFDALTPPFDSTPSKRTPFSTIFLIVCACMHQTGPRHGLKWLEGMKWCCFYHSIELMKVSRCMPLGRHNSSISL